MQRILTVLAGLCAAGTATAWMCKGALPSPERILPMLREEPLQRPTDRGPFSFTYRSASYEVRPVAAYDLYGLVVTHNDVSSIADAEHDADSVDTKDLCVVFGGALADGDYQRVEFESGSFTCYWRYPPGVRFDNATISNNHLVTADPAVRDRIARVRVGDQVYVRGLLVDYRAEGRPDGWWRRTSTTRRDVGGTACEVIYVEHIEILRRGTPGWYLAWAVGIWLTPALLLAKVGLFVAAALRGSTPAPGQGTVAGQEAT